MLASLDNGVTPFHTLDDPYPNGLVQPTRDSLGASTFLGQAPANWDANPFTGKNYQWNLDIQRELPWNVLMDIAYAGSRGVHLGFHNRELSFAAMEVGTPFLARVGDPDGIHGG
jgi:hypothetical protein